LADQLWLSSYATHIAKISSLFEEFSTQSLE
jgi:hypothetical protein